MSDLQLFEGDLVLLVAGGCLRVWAMAAEDLSQSGCCCGCCRAVAKELRWWGSLGIFAGGLGLFLVVFATALGTDLGFSVLFELLVATLAGVLITRWSWQDLATHPSMLSGDRTLPLVGQAEAVRSLSFRALQSAADRVAGTFQDRPHEPLHEEPSAPPLDSFEPQTRQALHQLD
ncbi:unnamed protein product [Effrenium voratum]|nr:unnamed protein product [Effrenium voratum]